MLAPEKRGAMDSEWIGIGSCLNSYVEALEGNDRFQVISRPFVFAANNQSATISSGLGVKSSTLKVDDQISVEEETLSLELMPMINPGGEVTLDVDLEFDHGTGTEGDSHALATSLRINDRDLVILSVGASENDEGEKFETILILQPHIIEASDELIDANTDKDSARPADKPATVEVDNILKRELKYLPAVDALHLAVKALTRSTGKDYKPEPQTRDRSGELESALVGDTLIIADPSSNHLIVNGAAEHLQIVGDLIDEVDQRPRSVYISAVIAQVTLGDDLRYGMDILRTVDEIDIGGEEIDLSELYRTSTGGTTILDPTSLNSVLPRLELELYAKALEEKSDGQTILASPTLMALNNKTSVIQPNPNLELEVTPLVNSKDEVTLEISIKSETLVDGDPENKSLQSLNTTVRLPDGGIAVLGGMIREEGDKRSETLVLIQPNIIPEKKKEAIFEIPQAPQTYKSWAQKTLGGNAEFDSDADADGIPNGLEYIFGKNQIVSPAAGQLSAPPEDVPADVTLSLEVSEDLKIWSEILRYSGGKLVSQAKGVTIDDGIVTDGREHSITGGQLYYRYRASQ